MQKTVLKGTRWLLLKNPENLDEEKNEKQRLEEALALNKPLATAYYSQGGGRTYFQVCFLPSGPSSVGVSGEKSSPGGQRGAGAIVGSVASGMCTQPDSAVR